LLGPPTGAEARLALGLAKAGTIAIADGPELGAADVAAIAYATGTLIGYGVDTLLAEDDPHSQRVVPLFPDLVTNEGELECRGNNGNDECDKLEAQVLSLLTQIKAVETLGSRQARFARLIRLKLRYNRVLRIYRQKCVPPYPDYEGPFKLTP
jgi:hypothetical protein